LLNVFLLLAFTAHAAPAGYELVWADEFNGASLNETNWSHWLPGKRRDAVNSPDAVAVTNGALVITTFTEGGKHFTGMVATEKKFTPTYGWFEARIRFHDAPGTWSAFWLQSPGIHRAGNDPARFGVEMDIVEHRHSDKTNSYIGDHGVINLHWDGYGPRHKSTGSPPVGEKLDDGFHTYATEWTPTRQDFFVDGQKVWGVTNPVSQRSEFLILSSEVEYHGWSGDLPTGGYGARDVSTNRMEVDFVRVYQNPAVTNLPPRL
jgi:beta-glucanase (GH16 family)